MENWTEIKISVNAKDIDKASDIERNTRGGERKSEAQAKVDSERIGKIEKLRSQGLITEEEYQKAISKEQ